MKEKKKGHELYYRGEDAIYKTSLKPSLFREKDKKHEKAEGQMLIDLITHKPEDFFRYGSAISHWSLAQHYRLPTRLLDITKNPLVALYFACGGSCDESSGHNNGLVHSFEVPRKMIKSYNSDSISVISSFAKLDKDDKENLIENIKKEKPGYRIKMNHSDEAKRLYGLIREEKPGFHARIRVEDLFRIFVVNPLMSFDRVRAQMGAFLISAFPYDYKRIQLGEGGVTNLLERRGVNRKVQQIISKEIYMDNATRVYSGCKCEIREELSHVGITEEFLFPEMDRLTKAIAQKHKDDIEDNNCGI